MGEDGAKGKDWLRAQGLTCVLQTHFSSFYYFCCCKIDTWWTNSHGETGRVRSVCEICETMAISFLN